MKYPSYIFSIILSFIFFIPSLAISSTKDIEQLDFANGLFQRGLYEMAQAEYQKFVEVHPESTYLSESYFGMAESSFFLKNYEAAKEAYNKYIEKFPQGQKKILIQLRLGQSLFFLDQYNEALKGLLGVSLEDLAQEFHQVLYFYIGKIYQAKNENELALENLQKSFDFNSENSQATHALLAMGDVRLAMEDYEGALLYYNEVYTKTELEDVKGFALYKQGEIQFLIKDYTSAVDTFRSLIEKYPQQKVAYDARINFFLALFNVSKYDEIISAFEQEKDLMKAEVNFFEIYYIAAESYMQLKKYAKAEKVLDSILVLEDLTDEQRTKGSLKKVEVFVKVQRFEEVLAIIALQFATPVREEDHILFLKAESFYGLKRMAEAYETYKNIMSKYPESPYMLDALYGAAHAQSVLSNDQEAMKLFIEYFQKGKNTEKRLEVLYNAIVIAKNLALLDEGIEYSQLYLSNFPQSTHEENVSFWLGTFYAEKKQHSKAADVLKTFSEKYPQSTFLQEANFLLAYNLQSSDNLEGAIEVYGKIEKNEETEKLLYTALKNTAFIHLEKKEEGKAAIVIDKILMEFDQHDLDNATILWLAHQYLTEKKFQDALRVLEKIKPVEGDLVNIEAVAYFRAQAHKELGEHQKALEQYEVVLTTDGDNIYDSAVYMEKGLSLMKIKNFLAARKEFEKTLLQNAEDNTIAMRARFELANVAKQLGELEQAAKLYMLVAVLYQDDYYSPEALLHAAKIFKSLNRHDEAQKIFDEILKDYPQSEAAGKVKEK
ncbi:hypothetical protein MNBD_UNCLBAC01-853 [hydrothermal vent metagenome]|uniref:Uncharacterized protein n=1 Tax=hydrothermal vent metagenome TaxID=652676 RepID=A0A3B1DAY2_9ZZZZ